MTARLTSVLARHGYITAVAAVALSTALFLLGRDAFAKGQWAILYLLVVLLVASVAGAVPALVAAVLAFFAWNFFFLPPYHTLAVHAVEDWLSLVAFLIVSVIVGLQAGRMREREARALARERETAALNRLSAAVVSSASTEDVARTCLAEAVKVLDADAATLVVADGEALRSYREGRDAGAEAAVEARAREALLHAGPALRATGAREEEWADDDGGLSALVRSPSGVVGLLAVAPRPDGRAYAPSEARLVKSLANLVGAFLERERLQQQATLAAAEREADRLKSTLLSSVSHELKTPLAALTATVSNLLEADVDWDEKSVRDELRAIVGDVARLNNSIGALLDLSRLEAHAWEPRREPYELGDIIAAGIDTLPAHLRGRVAVDLSDETRRGGGRLRPVHTRHPEPPRERLSVCRRRPRDHRGARRERRRAALGRRPRSGDPGERARSRVREVLPGPRQRRPGAVGYGPRPRHRPRDRAQPRGLDPRGGRQPRTAPDSSSRHPQAATIMPGRSHEHPSAPDAHPGGRR